VNRGALITLIHTPGKALGLAAMLLGLLLTFSAFAEDTNIRTRRCIRQDSEPMGEYLLALELWALNVPTDRLVRGRRPGRADANSTTPGTAPPELQT